MKMKFLRAGTVLFALVLLLYSCKRYEVEEGYMPGNAVLFSANINVAPQTKAANAAWSANDEIGIYMVGTGTTDVVDNTINRKYTTVSGDGQFSTTADHIFYPEDGSKVDFIAYYPYQSAINSLGSYAVNVANQDDQEAIDLLYAKATNDNNGYDQGHSSAVGLQFRHQLSRLKLVIAAPDPELGITAEELADLTASVAGLNTTATFNLAEGILSGRGNVAPIALHEVSGGSAYDAIIIPDAIAEGNVEVTFNAGSQSFTWVIPSITYESGKSYTYNITLVGKGLATGVVASIVDWQASADSDEFFIPPAELGTVVHTAAELSAAIAAAQPGDYISLAPGFRHEWTRNNRLTVTGRTWSEPITIQSADNANRAVLSGAPFSFVNSSGVIFKNLDFIRHSGSEYSIGIHINGGSRYAIVGCTFTNVRESVSTAGVSHLTIEYNDFLTTPETDSRDNFVDFVRAFQKVDFLKIRKNRMIMKNRRFGDLASWHPDFIQFAVSEDQNFYPHNRGGECILIEDNIIYRPDFFTFSPNPIWYEGALGVNVAHNANNNTQGIIGVHELLMNVNRSGYVAGSFEKTAYRKFVIRNNDFINSMANSIAIMCVDGVIIEKNRLRSTPGTPGTPGNDHWFSLDAVGNRTYVDARPTIMLYQVSAYRFPSEIFCRNVQMTNNSAPVPLIGGGQTSSSTHEPIIIGENASPVGWQDLSAVGRAYLPDNWDPWAWPTATLPGGWLTETPKDANGQWAVAP